MKWIRLILLLCLISSPLSAKISVDSAIETKTMEVGEGTYLTLIVKSDENNTNISDPDLSVLGNDFEVGSSYQSSSFSSRYANGQFVFEKIRYFKIQVIPQSEGQKEIPAIPIKVNNQIYKTPPIKITVRRAQGGGYRQQPGTVQPFMQTQPQQSQPQAQGQQGKKQKVAEAGQSFFVKAIADKTSVYMGEQIIVSYYLYTKVKIDSPDIDKRPEFKGFIKEDLEDVKVLKFSREVINGIPYNRALLGKYALYPIKAGTAYIDTMRVKALAYTKQSMTGDDDDEDDPFGMGIKGFFNIVRPVELYKDSTPIKVEVKPLPTQGQPQNFLGAVGDFELKADLSSGFTKAGQPVTLVVRIKGRGNLASIDKPNLPLPPSIEIFESKASADISPLGSGEKTFEYVLLPRAEGSFNIGPIEFSYFRPSKEEYKTVKAGPFVLNVKGGVVDSNTPIKPSDTPPVAASTGIDFKTKGRDIRYIKPFISDGDNSHQFYKNPLYYVAFIVVLIIVLLIYFVLEQVSKHSGNTKEKTRKHIISLISKARNAKTDDEMLKNITNALQSALAYVINVSPHGITNEALFAKYIEEKKDEKTVNRVKSILDKANTYRFAPGAEINVARKNVIDEAEDLIGKIL